MENPECVRVKLEDIPQEFIEEYHLLENERHGWVYFEISVAAMDYRSQAKLLTTCSEQDWRMHTTMK